MKMTEIKSWDFFTDFISVINPNFARAHKSCTNLCAQKSGFTSAVAVKSLRDLTGRPLPSAGADFSNEKSGIKVVQ